MAKERTLDEALDEIDRWSEKLNERLAGMTAEEAVEYFKQVDQQWEKKHPPGRTRQASSRSSASALRAQRRKKAV